MYCLDVFFFFKQKTAYEIRPCDWSSDVCSSDLAVITAAEPHEPYPHKTTQRDCFVDAAVEAEVAEADDALLLTHEGWVAEGTVWSVFWWEGERAERGERLRTPALELGILPGIGRARVLELT